MDINITSKKGATLHTANKYCSEDINVKPQTQQLNVTPSNTTQSFEGLYDTVNIDSIKLQSKVIIPTTEEQVVVADDGYDGLSEVTIGAVGEGGIEELFTQLEYIESTGTQYIKTNYLPNGNSCYEAKYSNNFGAGALFGAYNMSSDGVHDSWWFGSGLFINYSDNPNTDLVFWFNYNTNCDTKISIYNKSSAEVKINRGTVNIDEATFSTNNSNFGINYALYIFAGNWYGSIVKDPVSVRLHRFSISENNILLHDYIPVKDNKTGEVGLFDLVEGKFYGNAGTGSFIAGPIAGTTESIKYITDGLVNYFELNGDLTEKIMGNNGANNGLTFETEAELNKIVCKSGEGYGFFGTNDLPKNNFTISLLAKSDGTNVGEFHFLLSMCGPDGTIENNACAIKVVNEHLCLEYNYGSYSTTFNANDDKWHRYTATYQNGVIKIYADDLLIGSTTRTLRIDRKAYGIIGNWLPIYNIHFNGWLADILIYNRVLTAEEVAYNYEQDNLA